jgi:MFS family permease
VDGVLTDPGTRPAARWLPLVAGCLGTFLLMIYTTVVTVALPSIRADLHAGLGTAQWILDAFNVALAGLLLGMGSLSDNLGRKRLYLVGLALFGVATLACGLAPSAGALVAARAAQGCAGAAMFATILPLVGLTYRGADRARAFAVWGAVAGAGGGFGTVTGGVLAELAGWRWVFLGSLPLCAVTLVLAAVTLRESDRTEHRVDLPGIVTFTLAITALTFGIIHGGERGWTSPGTLGGLAGAVLLLGGFVAVERRTARPILPPALFGTRSFLGVLLTAFAYYPAAFGWGPVLVLWLRGEAGLGPLATSLLMFSQLAAFFVVSALVSGPLQDRPTHRVLGGATALVGLGCLTALLALPWPGWAALLPALVLTGCGAGVVSPVFPAAAIASVPPSHGGTAGAAANSSRQLGLALGIALSGAVYTGAGGGTSGLVSAVVLNAVLALVGGPLSGYLQRPRPAG